VFGLSIGFALIAADGGILASLQSSTVKPSVFVTGISFAIYVVARLAGPRLSRQFRVIPSSVEDEDGQEAIS
jgi:zinc/manganese transport system permease protein